MPAVDFLFARWHTVDSCISFFALKGCVQMPKKVTLITDGACIGNPGPAGWACILRHGEHKKELYGSEPKTTNNRMELKAVIAGLSALKEPCAVLVTTDSK